MKKLIEKYKELNGHDKLGFWVWYFASVTALFLGLKLFGLLFG